MSWDHFFPRYRFDATHTTDFWKFGEQNDSKTADTKGDRHNTLHRERERERAKVDPVTLTLSEHQTSLSNCQSLTHWTPPKRPPARRRTRPPTRPTYPCSRTCPRRRLQSKVFDCVSHKDSSLSNLSLSLSPVMPFSFPQDTMLSSLYVECRFDLKTRRFLIESQAQRGGTSPAKSIVAFDSSSSQRCTTAPICENSEIFSIVEKGIFETSSKLALFLHRLYTAEPDLYFCKKSNGTRLQRYVAARVRVREQRLCSRTVPCAFFIGRVCAMCGLKCGQHQKVFMVSKKT